MGGDDLLRRLKSMKGSRRHVLETLRNPARNEYTSDPQQRADLLIAEATACQGHASGDDAAGNSLLEWWDVDLSS